MKTDLLNLGLWCSDLKYMACNKIPISVCCLLCTDTIWLFLSLSNLKCYCFITEAFRQCTCWHANPALTNALGDSLGWAKTGLNIEKANFLVLELPGVSFSLTHSNLLSYSKTHSFINQVVTADHKALLQIHLGSNFYIYYICLYWCLFYV